MKTTRVVKTKGTCGGRARLEGSRVRVMDVVILHESIGLSPDEIVSQLPTLSLSDVHAALAYYYGHQEEVRREIESEERFVEEFMRTHPSVLEDRLARLRSKRAA